MSVDVVDQVAWIPHDLQMTVTRPVANAVVQHLASIQ
jgi:hypothetical protein